MNFLFSLLLLFLFIPKGHQFVQENYSEDDAKDLDVEGTDGIDLDKVYGQYYATEATIDENVESTVPPSSVKTDENGGDSEFLPTTAPATAIEGSEENLSSDNSELSSNRKEYSMFSKGARDAVVESNSDSNVEGNKRKSPKVLEKNANLAVESSSVNNKDSTRMERKRNGDGGQNSVLSEKLKMDLKKNQKPVARDGENKFQMKKEDKSGKGIIAVKSEQNVDLQENSTAKPPYVLKHKMNQDKDQKQLDDIYFLFIVIGCSVAGIAGLALAGYCWYKLHTTAKAVSEAEYPGTYGAMSGKQPVHLMQSGDQKLDYNAEMYHYQHTKNQLAAMEKAGGSRVIKGETLEDEENSDEGDEGDYTVYECPGLAPAGDMTVVNPMFSDQEQVASDQDANGTHSGRSAEGSPSFPRHTPKE